MVLGSIIRYDRGPFTWKSKSSQLLSRRSLIIGSVLCHLGVLFIQIGHVVGLLTPIAAFDALSVPHGAKQLLALVADGFAGAVALVGGIILLARALRTRVSGPIPGQLDNLVILLLLGHPVLRLGLIFPKLTHLDGAEMQKFMAWAQGIVFVHPDRFRAPTSGRPLIS